MTRITLPSILVAAALAANPGRVAAQTPPCLAANATTTTASGTSSQFSFSGENSFAWRFTPPSTYGIEAAQVFTSNSLISGVRFMAVEIWSDVNNAPGSRLGGGAWKIDSSRPLDWQGASFDRRVTLQQGTGAWLVWIEPGYSEIITEPGGPLNLQHATRIGAGAWNAQSPSAPKFRLFCNLLDGSNAVPFGQGCPLSTGRVPTVYTNEQPMLGNAGFFYESGGNPTGGAVFAVIGADPSFISAPVAGLPAGCLQNTDALASLVLFAGTGDTRGPSYDGHVALDFAIPNTAGLSGLLLAIQMVPVDLGATAPLPFGTSNALRITLF